MWVLICGVIQMQPLTLSHGVEPLAESDVIRSCLCRYDVLAHYHDRIGISNTPEIVQHCASKETGNNGYSTVPNHGESHDVNMENAGPVVAVCPTLV